MVAWQPDSGTLSWLSERGNFGTWERPSASECASECASACASASGTQSPPFPSSLILHRDRITEIEIDIY